MTDALAELDALVMGTVLARTDEPPEPEPDPEPEPRGWMAGVAADLAAEAQETR